MESHKYDDIINMPRPQSQRRKMTLHERAAQFSPFAALTGYEEAVKEAARLTDSRPEPDEDKINELNTKLSFLKTILSDRPEITVNYFIPKEKVNKISEWYRDRAYLFDNQSTEDDELGDLLEIMEKAVQQYGVQLLLLDNLMTALDVGMSVDLYRAQSKFVDKLVKIAKRQQVAVILVVHPRKNSFGADDNDSVSGSADITNKVDVVMTYKRGKELPENERILAVSKNRLTGKLAAGEKALTLYYDEASKRISDNTGDFTRCYGWEADKDGFMSVTEEQIKQMEIPFE